jgi:hypothetical protein
MGKMISRRNVFKLVLAATGSITASAFLPEKWIKPIVRAGVIPAHAQTSVTPTATTPSATNIPTETPTEQPSGTPTETPTEQPSGTPTETPTGTPTETPTGAPTETPLLNLHR